MTYTVIVHHAIHGGGRGEWGWGVAVSVTNQHGYTIAHPVRLINIYYPKYTIYCADDSAAVVVPHWRDGLLLTIVGCP